MSVFSCWWCRRMVIKLPSKLPQSTSKVWHSPTLPLLTLTISKGEEDQSGYYECAFRFVVQKITSGNAQKYHESLVKRVCFRAQGREKWWGCRRVTKPSLEKPQVPRKPCQIWILVSRNVTLTPVFFLPVRVTLSRAVTEVYKSLVFLCVSFNIAVRHVPRVMLHPWIPGGVVLTQVWTGVTALWSFKRSRVVRLTF